MSFFWPGLAADNLSSPGTVWRMLLISTERAFQAIAYRVPRFLHLSNRLLMTVYHVPNELLSSFKQDVTIRAFYRRRFHQYHLVNHAFFRRVHRLGKSSHESMNIDIRFIRGLYFQLLAFLSLNL